MKRLALILLALLLASPAAAQLRKGPAARAVEAIVEKRAEAKDETAVEDAKVERKSLLTKLAKPFQRLADFIGDDAENAIALATAIPGIPDGHGQQCWIAARNFTAVFKAHPLPLTGQAMTDLQALRLLAISSKQLCENTHCTQVFTDFKNMAITVAQAAAGQIGATIVRAAPSLQDVCVQVPNIPLADPIAVPPPPDVKPVGLSDTPAPK